MPQLSLHTLAGDLTVSEENGRIVAVDWGWGRDQEATLLLLEARTQLHAYFERALTRFDLPLSPAGSPYARRVWQALADIPHGCTRSYGQMAAAAGGSPRSAGRAIGANPIPIIIPCHRVLASAGLGGYSGGDGAGTKRLLLELEAGAQAIPMASHAGRRGNPVSPWRSS